jgi:hypothetical protein
LILSSSFCFVGLGLFYQFDQKGQKIAVRETIKRLNDIKLWFEKQTTYNFFASSILIIYESDLERMCEENLKNTESYLTQFVRAKMCDLTHIFRSDSKIDENYLFGLNCLIDHLKRLLNDDYVYEDPRINSLND